MYGCERRARLLAVNLLFAATLAACGGGGGSPTSPATAQPSTSAPPPSQTINASGTVVDDKTGSPLSGVRVVLMPWAPCGPTPSPASITPENDGCPTPLPSPQATTNAQGQFTLNGAPNGHYLLVIGSDTVSTPPPGYAPPTCTTGCPTPSPAPFTVQATVHDNVTLRGGAERLVAPTIPPVPTITPKPWETNGDYRLATLDAQTEMPCYIAWQYDRAQRGLAGSSIDEWLVEDVRAINGYIASGGTQPQTALTTAETWNSGGTDCANSLLGSNVWSGGFPEATNPREGWFAGQYVPYDGGSVSASGLAEFPVDPRSLVGPSLPTWL
jgi:hypothetical protein